MSKKTNSGKNLNREWDVGVRHPLYRDDGRFYMRLERFPGALFDANGYLLFETEQDYLNCAAIKIGKRVNIPCGIANIPRYIRKR